MALGMTQVEAYAHVNRVEVTSFVDANPRKLFRGGGGRVLKKIGLAFLVALGFLVSFSTWAATGTFRIYVDSDAKEVTGCAANLVDRFGAIEEHGFEHRITIAVDASGNVNQPVLATCSAGAFSADQPIGQAGPQIAVVSAGANLLAQLELSLLSQAVGASPTSRVVLAADGDYINRLSPKSTAAITLNGAGTGVDPDPGATPTVRPIPTASGTALLLLVVLLAGLGVAALRTIGRGNAPHWLAVIVFTAISSSGIAAVSLVIDGNTNDWAGLSPIAVDMSGDQVAGTADLHSLTASFQGDQLFLRIDAIEGPNPQRSLSVLESESVLPRFTSHPSLAASVGQPWRYAPRATDQSGQTITLGLTQNPVGMQLTGAVPNQQLAWTPAAAGTYWVSLQALDSAGRSQVQTFPIYVSDDRRLPADPATRATALSPTGFTPFAEHTAFLYEGADPIQTGMRSGAIDPVTATVVRGQVLDAVGLPLPGATVRIAGHPEYGQTRTRADGWYDLAANGGGWITVHIEKPGYMSAQRRFQAPWRDWALAPDVVLLPHDAQYTRITSGSATPQLYWGSAISDGRGERRTSVYFPPGTQASAVMPDGSTRTLTQMNVRASEYTIGSRGPQSMPAELNLAVGYTWAANFTVDEAEAIGAESVRFSQPVVAYIDNFIDMPVGSAVPAGWYDFNQTTWVGEDNGRIVQVLGVDAHGKAIVQVTPDARAATAAELLALGFDDDELTVLARTRAVGTALWRVRMAHFTPWDCNWPWGPPPDVEPPPADPPPNDPPDGPPPSDPPPDDQPPDDDGCPVGQDCACLPGCDVLPAMRAVGQDVDLPGTPFSLYYRSDRVASSDSRLLRVRATGATLPPLLNRVTARHDVAGRRLEQSIPREGWRPNETFTMAWDGKDAYGRLTTQRQNSVLAVSYMYPAVRYEVPGDLARAFERVQPQLTQAGADILPSRDTGEVALARSSRRQLWGVKVNSPEVAMANAGGWALRGLRLYDPSGERLYEGGGLTYDAKAASLPARLYGQVQVSDLATMARERSAMGADGALYFSDSALNQVRRVWLYGARKGLVEVLAGTGEAGGDGDGGPAIAARLDRPGALALAPDGGIVFMDEGNQRLRRVTAAGTILTIAGNGAADARQMGADPASALEYPISASSIAVTRDMTVWALSRRGDLRQISPAGIVSGYRVGSEQVREVASSPDGIVWLNTAQSIYRFNDSGVLRSMPNTVGATRLLPDHQGGAYFHAASGRYSHLSRAGEIADLGSSYLQTIDHGAVTPLATDAAGHVIGAKLSYWSSSAVIGVIGNGLPPFGEAIYRIPRADGSTLEEFDRLGRPVALRSTFGGQLLRSYQYDANGQLAAVTDSHGNVTTLERDGQGRIAAVAGPFGQRTTLGYDGRQLVQVLQPGGLVHGMEYASATSDLLTAYRDPRGGVDRFAYTASGRLNTNRDPAGGGWQLSSSVTEDNYWTTNRTLVTVAQSAEGRTTRYQTDIDRWSGFVTKTTNPDGTQSVMRSASSGWSQRQDGSGMSIITQASPDPRLGLVASQTSQNIDYGNGRHRLASTGRSLSNLDDPDAWQAPSNWRETTLLNGRDSWVTSYFGNGEFSQASPLGRTQSVQLNAHQKPRGATLSSGLQLSYTYNGTGQLASLSSTDGATSRNASFSWHPSGPGGGQLASRTNALGQTERFAYDGAGRLATHTLVDGRILSYSWDAAGNMTGLTTPAGVTHSFNYSAVQQPSGYTPPAGGVTQWNYDRDRKLTGIVRPGGQSLAFSRLPSGQLSAVIDSTGARTSYSWRADGRLASATTADGQAIAYSYNGAQLQALGFGLQGASASLGLVHESVSSWWYGPDFITGRIGSLKLSAGGQDVTLVQRYDADGLLVASGPLQLGRSAASGQLEGVVLGRFATAHKHDVWGLLSASATMSQTVAYAAPLDSDRQALKALILALRDRIGGTITERGDCDVMRPASTRICPRAARVAKGANSSKVQSASIKPQAKAKPAAKNTRTKDACVEDSTITSAEQAADNHMPWPPRAPEWESYNACQASLQYRIDDMLRFLNEPQPAPLLQSQLSALIADFNQGPSNFISASQLPAPVPVTFTRSYIDPQAQQLIDQINATLSAWQANQSLWRTALGQTHTRDALGRITQSSEVLLGQGQPAKSYQYDTAGRLTRASQGAITTTWGYDANGNRTHENGQAIASYDSQDRLITWKGATYQYNGAGDLSKKTSAAGSATYDYDTQGNLRSVTLEDGRQIRYAIDPDNRRTGKTINGQLQWQLVWQSPLRPIARLKADGALEAVYHYADKANVPEAMDKGDRTYRIVSDHLGSVRLVIDANMGGVEHAEVRASPYSRQFVA